ncbi:MAG: ThiF family adenylyltransferase, partial [Bacteroidia bacterium]|nr:ThiF family adenylyltransferase [Bacteroidia bacterium]
TKYLLNDACVILNKPLVSGSIEGFEGQVAVFNFMDGPTYRCLFPEPPAKENTSDCNTIGVTTTLPLIVGNIQANEAVKIISGIGEVLSGKVLLVNMLNNSFVTLNVKTDQKNKNIATIEKRNDFTNCSKPEISGISFSEFSTKKNEFWLLDVRNETEHAAFNIGGKNIPVYELDALMEELPTEEKILTYCNEGMVAKQAALLISRKKNLKVYYLNSPLSQLTNS